MAYSDVTEPIGIIGNQREATAWRFKACALELDGFGVEFCTASYPLYNLGQVINLIHDIGTMIVSIPIMKDGAHRCLALGQ